MFQNFQNFQISKFLNFEISKSILKSAVLPASLMPLFSIKSFIFSIFHPSIKSANLEPLTARIAPLKIFRRIDVRGVDYIEVGAAPGSTSVVGEVVDG